MGPSEGYFASVMAVPLAIVFAPAARDEFHRAAEWYDEKKRGLGYQFVLMVEAKLNSIAKSPDSFPLVHQHFRRALVRRFPFAIYFERGADGIHVLAIHHTSHIPPEFLNR